MATDAPTELIAVAHNLRSLHNVGAIFRTADGAGFTRVVLSGYTGTPPDPRIAKVALGADETLTWAHAPTDDELLAEFDGVFVVLLEQDAASVSPTDVASVLPVHGSIALIACEELFGAPDWLRERADCILELPMYGQKESLNVSVAFGIAAYAIAQNVHPHSGLRSRSAPRGVRPGVLTNGPTIGETPLR